MSQQAPFPLLFSGSSHPALAKEIADCLDIKLGEISLKRFPDGEAFVQILENVRGQDVFVIQSIAIEPDKFLMELLIIVDALKRASAKSITAVLPYYGYCRQDRKDKPRVPITSKLVANLLVSAGVSRVVTMDLHAGQVQGFFDIPVDNLFARPLLLQAFKREANGPCVVVAPDIGSIKLARAFARSLDAKLAVIDKQRIDPSHIEKVTLIGDVKGKYVLLADDMCSTAGTLESAAKACQEKGAEKIFAVITHGIFTDDAIAKIDQSPILALFTSNTIPLKQGFDRSDKIQSVSIAPLFAHAIRCILSKESISSLYELDLLL